MRTTCFILWCSLCKKLYDGSVSAMRKRHHISNTNPTTALLLCTHHPRICNLTKNHLGSSPDVVKLPPVPNHTANDDGTHVRLTLWSPFQYPIRHLIVRYCEVANPRDCLYKLSHRFEIWESHRQQCCRGACQISGLSINSKYKSRG